MSLNGFNAFFGSLSGSGGTIDDGATGNSILTVGNGSSSTYGGSLVDGGTGKLSLVITGGGVVTLTGINTYSGGTTVSNGTLAVSSDSATGTGPVTISPLGTLSYSANTSTSKSFNLGGGILAVNAGAVLTINGGSITSGFLNGAGTFATDPTNGGRFANVTSQPGVTIVANSVNDRFVNFTNGGILNVAEGVGAIGTPPTAVNFSGFTNQGSGSITVASPVTPAPAQTGAFLNVSNFQSYGTLTVNPATVGSGQSSLITNVGTSPLGFNGGSRTFIGTPATASPADSRRSWRGSIWKARTW